MSTSFHLVNREEKKKRKKNNNGVGDDDDDHDNDWNEADGNSVNLKCSS